MNELQEIMRSNDATDEVGQRDMLALGEALLSRAKAVSQRITDRIQRVADDPEDPNPIMAEITGEGPLFD